MEAEKYQKKEVWWFLRQRRITAPGKKKKGTERERGRICEQQMKTEGAGEEGCVRGWRRYSRY